MTEEQRPEEQISRKKTRPEETKPGEAECRIGSKEAKSEKTEPAEIEGKETGTKELGPKGAEPKGTEEEPAAGKRLFGRGIYGSKDVPIRLLDKLIAGAIILTVFLIIYSTVNGGFHVRFDTAGGSAVEEQVLRYGELVSEPEAPVKPGYVFSGWKVLDSGNGWNFRLDTVSGSMTLVARWEPAKITVRFDPAGGSLPEGEAVKSVTYEGTYGELPVPERPGYGFSGWVYSGKIVTADSMVLTNGEHVLTAQWTKKADQ